MLLYKPACQLKGQNNVSFPIISIILGWGRAETPQHFSFLFYCGQYFICCAIGVLYPRSTRKGVGVWTSIRWTPSSLLRAPTMQRVRQQKDDTASYVNVTLVAVS